MACNVQKRQEPEPPADMLDNAEIKLCALWLAKQLFFFCAFEHCQIFIARGGAQIVNR